MTGLAAGPQSLVVEEDVNSLSEIQIAEIFAACLNRIPKPILKLVFSVCVGYTAIAVLPIQEGFPTLKVALISTHVIALYSIDRVRFFTAYSSRDFVAFDLPVITVSHYSIVLALAMAASNHPYSAAAATMTAYVMAYWFALTESKQRGARLKCLKALAAVDCAIGILLSALFQ